MDIPQGSVEQKLAEAARIIRDAARQFEEAGLELDFEIRIKSQRPVMDFVCITDPGEKTSPLK